MNVALAFFRHRAFWRSCIKMICIPEVREVERRLYKEYMHALKVAKVNEN